MDYFAELGGDRIVMSAASYAALDVDRRLEFLARVAESMAPSILGRVSMTATAAEIRGRYAVHAALVELSVDGSFVLRLATRRKLDLPSERRIIHGPPSDPSRHLLDPLPHGTGALLNRLLDSIPGYVGSFSMLPDEVVLALNEPTRMALSDSAPIRLASVTHLSAYLAVEAEQRWPLDPNAPLLLPPVEQDVFQHLGEWHESRDMAPPVPGYGIPPGAHRR